MSEVCGLVRLQDSAHVLSVVIDGVFEDMVVGSTM
jgi:hypothetical protein